MECPAGEQQDTHPQTQRTDTVPGHCRSTSGTSDTTGHSEHWTQRPVRHLRGGSEAVLGLPETRPGIARTPANRLRTTGHNEQPDT
eukprot:15464948-Alexandrium_andersonii.AAC.1